MAWEEEGREEGFLTDCGPGVVLRGGRTVRTGGFGGRAVVAAVGADAVAVAVALAVAVAVASGAKRSACRGWREEWRELELGVCNVGASPSTDAIASPS